jgi:hypothetical protein
VSGDSSYKVALTAVPVVPVTVPGVAGLVNPYPVFNPYSKYTVVSSPFAFTVPLTVAISCPIPDDPPVVAVGDDWPKTGKPDVIMKMVNIKWIPYLHIFELFIVYLFGFFDFYHVLKNISPKNRQGAIRWFHDF